MQNIYTYYYKFEIGYLKLSYTDLSIVGLVRAKENQILTNSNYSNSLLKKAIKQLDEYFSGQRIEFDLPLQFSGTEFQKEVWKALINIPYGETRSYKDIAIEIGNPKACRAVGGANNKNPIILICPCHRVIGASGKLVGYGGGMDMKEYLLNLEKSYLK
jgi:methylated-DNA-[protein]-cysteine S-methyltransferase